MRILVLSNLYPPGFVGGYELGAADIVSALAARGHEIEVVTSNYLVDDTGGDRGGNGAPAVHRTLECNDPSLSPLESQERIWLAAYALPRNLREVAGRLRTCQPEAVLCFNLAGLGAPSLLRLLAASGVRPVVYMMDNVFSRACAEPSRKAGFERVFSREAWPDTTRFLFMSQRLREEVEDETGLTFRHAQIAPGWFDPDAESGDGPREAPVVRFVFASRVAGHKGIDVLLDACRLLVDAGCTEFSVDIYGNGEVATALQRITALRLQPQVTYKGAPEKSALMPLLSEYDALLFPTWQREPFGFIVPEAAVAGCIPVMTYGIGAAEWFLDGSDCFKINRDPASLQAAMMSIVLMSTADRQAMQLRARQTALRFCRFDDAVDRVEAALTEAAGPPLQNARTMEAALAVLTEIWRARPHG